MAELVVTVPSWMLDKLADIANLCEESIDHVAAAFFAAEVVHTSRNGIDTSFYR